MTIIFRCPECLGELRTAKINKAIVCKKCNQTYSNIRDCVFIQINCPICGKNKILECMDDECWDCYVKGMELLEDMKQGRVRKYGGEININ